MRGGRKAATHKQPARYTMKTGETRRELPKKGQIDFIFELKADQSKHSGCASADKLGTKAWLGSDRRAINSRIVERE